MLAVTGASELRAAAALWGRLDAPTRAAMRKEAAAWAPTLRRAAMRRASDPLSLAIAESGKITVNNKGLVARFGASGRTASGSPLRDVAAPFEFGTVNPDEARRYTSRTAKGKAYRLTRKVQRQVPGRRDTGRFLYPAVADTTPALVARWVRAIAEVAADGR